ncbi:hypothetical protein D3C76_1693590 [compost metagenome]
MARLCLSGSNLHCHRIELAIITFDVGLYERFELFGAGHFYYPVLCKIGLIRGYCDDAVLWIGEAYVRDSSQRRGQVMQIW